MREIDLKSKDDIVERLFNAAEGATEEGVIKFLGVHWKTSAKMFCIILDHSWMFPFIRFFRVVVWVIYQIRQFKKMTTNPEPGSLACWFMVNVYYDVTFFWHHKIVHTKYVITPEDDPLQGASPDFEPHTKE